MQCNAVTTNKYLHLQKSIAPGLRKVKQTFGGPNVDINLMTFYSILVMEIIRRLKTLLYVNLQAGFPKLSVVCQFHPESVFFLFIKTQMSYHDSIYHQNVSFYVSGEIESMVLYMQAIKIMFM